MKPKFGLRYQLRLGNGRSSQRFRYLSRVLRSPFYQESLQDLRKFGPLVKCGMLAKPGASEVGGVAASNLPLLCRKAHVSTEPSLHVRVSEGETLIVSWYCRLCCFQAMASGSGKNGSYLLARTRTCLLLCTEYFIFAFAFS